MYFADVPATHRPPFSIVYSRSPMTRIGVCKGGTVYEKYTWVIWEKIICNVSPQYFVLLKNKTTQSNLYCRPLDVACFKNTPDFKSLRESSLQLRG